MCLDERSYNQPPASHFDSDASLDYDVFKCGHCLENHSDKIHFDHMNNCNICTECIENDDCQMMLGLDNKEFDKWKNKVLKQNPINPI